MNSVSPAARAAAKVLVRQATAEDAGELVRLRKIMLDSLDPSDDVSWQRFAVEDLRNRLADPDGGLVVFVVDRMAGSATGAGAARGDSAAGGDGPEGAGTAGGVSRPGQAAGGASGDPRGAGGADRPSEAGGADATAGGDGALRTEGSRGGGARAGRALAACAAGTVERRLAGPGNPAGLCGHLFSVATDGTCVVGDTRGLV